MKNFEVLLEKLEEIEIQLVENNIIKEGSKTSDIIGSIKENIWREIHNSRLKDFRTALNDLVDEYHPHLYLLDNVFKGLDSINIGILDELNRDR
jgi:hypothetical protein